MPKRSKFQSILLMIIVCIGLIPIFYLTIIKIGIAQAASDSTDTQVVDTSDPIGRYIDNLAFGVHEKFTYDVNYGFINAGSASMEIKSIIEYQERPCFQIVTTAKSNSFFTSVFNVDDKAETIIDAEGIFSWRFEKNLREGSYVSDRQYDFNQKEHFTVYKGDTIIIEEYVQDALSMLYYIRTQELTPGKSFDLDTFVDGKKFKTKVNILKREKISVEAGSFDCVVVEPLMSSVGVFKHQGSLKVWLTDDKVKIPVLMKTKVLVGSISAELTEFNLGEIEEF